MSAHYCSSGGKLPEGDRSIRPPRGSVPPEEQNSQREIDRSDPPGGRSEFAPGGQLRLAAPPRQSPPRSCSWSKSPRLGVSDRSVASRHLMRVSSQTKAGGAASSHRTRKDPRPMSLRVARRGRTWAAYQACMPRRPPESSTASPSHRPFCPCT